MENRRDFFKKLIPTKREEEDIHLYPPYFNEIIDFEKCKECENKPCIKACEEEIIILNNDKPSLDFSKSGCTFCDECAKVCEKDVLKVEYKKELPKVKIDILKCVAWNKTICSMCKDICDVNAIDFMALFNPEINEKCNGCGFCIGVCPTFAIEIGGEI
ncbi:4Fe-4S binding protein [Nitrosophilus kaiyonis]|uniref:4Fe-4S binding protein n=1 Tax=Nitrosophilus kaiyonis TaxID=2930200 RepID=UPI002492AED8|nr:4Fe-4S binding protein [Nitrosophilus kaiyonis]